MQQNKYDESNPRWSKTATVRNSDYSVRDEENHWYSHERMPFLAHPLLGELDDEAVRALEIRQLYQYLDTIRVAEQLVVNPLAVRIAHGVIGAINSPGFRVGAQKLYTDEAYHAQVALEFRFDVERLTGLAAPVMETPTVFVHLAELQTMVPAEMHDLAWFFLTGVYETQIQGDLRHAGDATINAEVRRVFLDHSKDEATHRAYFIKAMDAAWREMSPDEHRTIGAVLPEFLLWCSEPSCAAALRRDLEFAGVPTDTIDIVIRESLLESFGVREAVEASGPTIKLFEQLGIFADASTRRSFADAGVPFTA